MKSLKKQLLTAGYLMHNLSLSKKSQHIITKVKLNGYEGRFIIDTGASATCVDQGMYKEFKLETQFMDSDIGTASGSIRPRVAHHNVLEVGDWEDQDMTVLSMDMTFINNALKKERMRSIQGLLGADFLLAARAIIDYGSKKIYLKG